LKTLSESQIKDLLAGFIPQLHKEEIEQFYNICVYKRAKKREIIFKKGRIDDNLIFILKGSARAFQINKNGKEINNHLRSEGYAFGEALAFSHQAQILDIQALSDLHYLRFQISEFEKLAMEHPRILKFYLNLLKEIILTFSHRINSFVSMSASERYKDLINWNPKYLDVVFDKHIASFLGVSPLTIHRIKNKEDIK
jgi:CRP-like cAMP-binding protein